MSVETDEGKRRETLIKLASAAVFLTIVAVAEVERELQDIPQDGMVLGQPGAKVTLREFADLQCPFCKGYAEDQLRQVIENLDHLPEDRREALIMRFALGMDNREIARALGRTDGATKVLIHRAIRQLQEEMGGSEDE